MNKYYDLDPNRNDQYFVRIDPDDNQKIDMSFNLSNYQPQLIKNKNRTIFQTIFLDDTRSHLWSRDEIDRSKIILEKWWHQFAHTWKHFAYEFEFYFLPLIQEINYSFNQKKVILFHLFGLFRILNILGTADLILYLILTKLDLF